MTALPSRECRWRLLLRRHGLSQAKPAVRRCYAVSIPGSIRAPSPQARPAIARVLELRRHQRTTSAPPGVIPKRCRGQNWSACRELKGFRLRMVECGNIYVEGWAKNRARPVFPIIHPVGYGRIASPANTLQQDNIGAKPSRKRAKYFMHAVFAVIAAMHTNFGQCPVDR